MVGMYVCVWGVSCRYRALVSFGTKFVCVSIPRSVHPIGGSLSACSLCSTIENVGLWLQTCPAGAAPPSLACGGLLRRSPASWGLGSWRPICFSTYSKNVLLTILAGL